MAEELVTHAAAGKIDEMTCLSKGAGGFVGELFLVDHGGGDKFGQMRGGGNRGIL